MEVRNTFCHIPRVDASDLIPTLEEKSPLDWFYQSLDTIKAKFSGKESDWDLIEKYLLMPLFDQSSIHELDLSKSHQNRLYWVMSQNPEQLSEMLRCVSYEIFFAEVAAFNQASLCNRSRFRPHLIGDDTKVAKTFASCMQYLTKLFCPAEARKLPCYNLVVLIATFGETKWEIPIDIKVWLPKSHKNYQSKPKLLLGMVDRIKAEAKSRHLSLDGIYFSCDAAYQRSHALVQTVVDAQLTLVTKVSANMTFWLNGQKQKAAEIRDSLPLSQMKQSGRLGWQYRYARIRAEHPQIGPVLLIVSVFFDEKHQKYRRILLMTTDLSIQAPKAIVTYKIRWRIEVFNKSIKSELSIATFQLRRFTSIVSHFLLRVIGYFLLNLIRRCGFVHRSRWTLRKVKQWLRNVLTARQWLKAP